MTSELKNCSDLLKSKGFKDEAKLIAGIASGKAKFYVVVGHDAGAGYEESLTIHRSTKVYQSKKAAEHAATLAVGELLLEKNADDIQYWLEYSNDDHHGYSESQLVEKGTEILGKKFTWPPKGKTLLPKGTSVEKACEIANLFGLDSMMVAEVKFEQSK